MVLERLVLSASAAAFGTYPIPRGLADDRGGFAVIPPLAVQRAADRRD